MAKTNWPSVAGPSSSPPLYVFLILSPPPPPNPTRHSLRSRRRRSPPGIFAFLATLSASHFSVHAHPLDPPQPALPFLYPPFVHSPTPSVAKRSLPSSTDATTSTPPLPSYSRCTQEQADMPDKYVLGEDGYWHKTEWSLYGSTQCPVSKSFPSPISWAPLQTHLNSLKNRVLVLLPLLQDKILTSQMTRRRLATLMCHRYQRAGISLTLPLHMGRSS